MSELHPQAPKGAPGGIGGQWVNKDLKRGAQGQIDPSSDADRVSELLEAGYSHADIVRSKLSASRRTNWWQEAPELPDPHNDATMPADFPSRRWNYAGDDVGVNMPSAASLTKWAEQNEGKTIRVPVSLVNPDGTTSTGWVRLTKGENNQWASQAMGFGDNDDLAAESVRSVLESRRRSAALTSAGAVMESRKARREAEGIRGSTNHANHFITHTAYDEESRTAYIAMGGVTKKEGLEKTYAYHDVDPATWHEFEAAESKGKAYNKLVKASKDATGQMRRSTRAHLCPKCHRFTKSEGGHTCPAQQAEVSTKVTPGPRIDNSPISAAPVSATPMKEPGKPDLRQWGSDNWGRATEDGSLQPGPSAFGPDVRRGFTMSPGVIASVESFTDATHNPHQFRKGKAVTYTNGDDGSMSFNGMDSSNAKMLARNLPAGNMNYRSSRNAPRVGTVLNAVSNSGGKLEAHGVMVPPHRTDERVEVNGVYAFVDAKNPAAASVAVQKLGLRDQGMGQPRSIEEVEVPWRPGEKAWKFTW